MNVSTNKKSIVPTMVKRTEYRYKKSIVPNNIGMLVIRNIVKYEFRIAGIVQYSNIGTTKRMPAYLVDCRHKFVNNLKNR